MNLFPNKNQWIKWTLPSKYALLGLLVSIIGLAFAVFVFVWDKQPEPAGQGSVRFGDNAQLTADNDILVSAGHINIQRIIQGVDERKLKNYLDKLPAADKPERIQQVESWYNDAEISAALKEALITVIDLLDKENQISQETIRRLRAENRYDLAELLEGLNRVFREDGPDELEREEARALKQIQQKNADDTIEIYLNTAGKFEAALQFKKAKERLEKALALQEAYFSGGYERYAYILNQLGRLCNTLAEYDKAIEYSKKALISNLRTYGLGHPSLAINLINWGEALQSKGQYDEAVKYYEKALAYLLTAYDQAHPFVAETWNRLGLAWGSKGEYDKAVEYYVKALASNLNTHGPDHPAVAKILNNLGEAWRSKGEYDKAIEYYEKSLASDLNTHGPDHPAMATAWNNLGLAWDSKGEYDKAIEYYEKSLAVFETVLGNDHPTTKTVRNNLGITREAVSQ